MATLYDILPSADVPAKTAQRLARRAVVAGLITPEDHGDGVALEYSGKDADTLREFVRLVRGERRTIAQAVDILIASRGTAHRLTEPHEEPHTTSPALMRSHEEATAGETAPDPADILRAELTALRVRVDAAAAARETERRELASIIEAERGERERIRRDADLEHRHSITRISLLESSIKKGRPRSLWQRIRLAWGVIIGDVAAVPALPEISSAVAALKKAA